MLVANMDFYGENYVDRRWIGPYLRLARARRPPFHRTGAGMGLIGPKARP